MGPDIHLDPDAVARVATTVRRIADGLPAEPPLPPHGRPIEDPVRSVRDAVAELLTFAGTAEATVSRTRNAEQAAARELRTLHEPTPS